MIEVINKLGKIIRILNESTSVIEVKLIVYWARKTIGAIVRVEGKGLIDD